MYKLHVSANSGYHQVYYRFSEEVIHVGGGIDKEISCINFVLMSGVATVYSTIAIS